MSVPAHGRGRPYQPAPNFGCGPMAALHDLPGHEQWHPLCGAVRAVPVGELMSPASKFLAVLVFFLGEADAQELLWAREGIPSPWAAHFGDVATLGDVDGDRYDDLIQIVHGT